MPPIEGLFAGIGRDRQKRAHAGQREHDPLDPCILLEQHLGNEGFVGLPVFL